MNGSVDPLYALRRERLKRWMREQELTGREVAKAAGWSSAAHVTNLVRGHSAFGERVARQVEQKLRMPEGYLDEETPVENAVLAAPSAGAAAAPDVHSVVVAVLLLRDAMGPDFMDVPLHKVELAVRMVLVNPELSQSAAALLKK